MFYTSNTENAKNKYNFKKSFKIPYYLKTFIKHSNVETPIYKGSLDFYDK